MNRNIITNDMQFNENKAIYIQIAERIADEIMLGVYNEDERIPSVREYAARMEVNINTALRSYAYLEQTGVIYQRRGLGYFISPDARQLIVRHYKEDFFGTFLPEMFNRMDMLGIGIEEEVPLFRPHLLLHQRLEGIALLDVGLLHLGIFFLIRAAEIRRLRHNFSRYFGYTCFNFFY